MKKNRRYLLTAILSLPVFLFSQAPFRCDGSMFVASYQNHRVYRIAFDEMADTVTLSPLPNPIGFEVLAMGYSKMDNFIYGAAFVNNEYSLCRIDSTGSGTLLKPIPLDATKFTGIFAGDITPNGETLIFFLNGAGAFDNPNKCIIIDLTSPTYDSYEVIVSTLAGTPNLVVFDILYHPINELLYGHDIQGTINNQPNPYGKKTILIDPYTGIVDNLTFFDTPVHYNSYGSMLTTPFGRIFGLSGIRQLWSSWSEMDAETGISTKVDFGPYIDYNPDTYILRDGCSCPYTLAMQKVVDRDSTYGCTEVTFTYRISNLLNKEQEQVSFRDSFPTGFEIREIVRNPYGGVVTGLNTNKVTISDIDLQYGLDSIILKVWVPEGAEGTHYTQALLTNVDLSSANLTTNAVRSDYPPTVERWDATPLTVIPLEVELSAGAYELCPDSSLLVQPVQNTEGLQFQWSDGSDMDYIHVTEEGAYAVTVTGGCEKDSATFEVVRSPLNVELGPDMEGQFGDWIEIGPTVDFLSPIESYEWQSTYPDSLLCDTCPAIAFELLGNTTIGLTIENEVGCQTQDVLSIEAIRQVYYPSAFSPNGDGINDWFFLQSKNPLTIKTLKIFDRWGGLVFHKDDIITSVEMDGWDGTRGNDLLQNGVYVWMAEVEFPDGASVLYKSEIALIK